MGQGSFHRKEKEENISFLHEQVGVMWATQDFLR